MKLQEDSNTIKASKQAANKHFISQDNDLESLNKGYSLKGLLDIKN